MSLDRSVNNPLLWLNACLRTTEPRPEYPSISRLHSDLEQLHSRHHKLPTRMTSPKSLTRISHLLREDTTTRARVARQRKRHIWTLTRQIDETTTPTVDLVKTFDTTPTDVYDVGLPAAAEILAEAGNPHRYTTKDKFAMANGTAPIEASSGRVKRHRLNRGGNRQHGPDHPHLHLLPPSLQPKNRTG